MGCSVGYQFFVDGLGAGERQTMTPWEEYRQELAEIDMMRDQIRERRLLVSEKWKAVVEKWRSAQKTCFHDRTEKVSPGLGQPGIVMIVCQICMAYRHVRKDGSLEEWSA